MRIHFSVTIAGSILLTKDGPSIIYKKYGFVGQYKNVLIREQKMSYGTVPVGCTSFNSATVIMNISDHHITPLLLKLKASFLVKFGRSISLEIDGEIQL